jgi:anti-sigma-K factor RskA
MSDYQDDAFESGLLADVLADPSTWAEPRGGLEDDVLRAVGAAAPAHKRGVSRRRRLFAVAGAAAAAAVITGLVVAGGGAALDFDGQLVATQLAPRAAASVGVRRTDAGFRIALNARGLPALTGGDYYQAWVKNAAGTSVPIGTFSSSDDHVTLWSGVSPVAFETITVTIERPDGNQASSGRVVLIGQLRRH